MRTAETFKEINHDHRRFFGGVASTLDLSGSRRRAAEEGGEDGLPVPPSKARPGAEGDRVVIGRIAMRDLLADLRVVTGFFVVPPLVGLVVALTTLPNLYAFWPVFCVATTVAGFAILLLAVPTFLIQEQSGRTGLGTYLRNGALLGCIVSGAVEVPLFGQLLAHVLSGEPIDEIAEAISSVVAYCAFLGIVGAATFWLVARPDHARWRGRSGESISHGADTDREIGQPGRSQIQLHPTRGAQARKAQQPSYDPYSSLGLDDSKGWIGPLPVKVVVLDLTEDLHGSSIQRGMRVLDLGCGVGDVSLWIAKLVGPTGLVVGVDESAECIDLAEKRATVAGQCYWTRFVTADLNTFVPDARYDVVIMQPAFPLRRERSTFLRLSTWLRPDGVIIVMAGKPAGSTDN